MVTKRVKGIEPSSLAWKAIALPLSYTRGFPGTGRQPPDLEPEDLLPLPPKSLLPDGSSPHGPNNGECRIRTCEGKAIRFTV